MIEKKDILKMVKSVSKRAAGKPDKRLIHPRREWFIGISLFLLIVIVGAVYSAHVYTSLDRLEDSVSESDTSVIRYQAGNVQTALDRYQATQQKFETMRAALPDVPPPVSEVVVDEEVVQQEIEDSAEEAVIADDSDLVAE